MFELFEHTADLGLRLRSSTLEELLAAAGRGLVAMLIANPHDVAAVQTKTIRLAAPDDNYLLFDWLNELLYIFETEKLLLAEFDIQLQGRDLTAICRGETFDASRHQRDHEVKAITYHRLRVERTARGWEAEVIVDI